MPFEDLLAAGNLGLVEAAIRFDPSRGVKFVTYADWWIRKSILSAIEEQASTIRLPRYRQEQLRIIHAARADARASMGREPTLDEICRMTGLGAEETDRLLALGRQTVSLDASSSPGSERPLHETLAAPGEPGPHEQFLHRSESGRIRHLVEQLGIREQAILSLRYGLAGGPPLTLRDVGRRLGVSRERVRQIEHRALLHLRRMLQSG